MSLIDDMSDHSFMLHQSGRPIEVNPLPERGLIFDEWDYYAGESRDFYVALAGYSSMDIFTPSEVEMPSMFSVSFSFDRATAPGSINDWTDPVDIVRRFRWNQGSPTAAWAKITANPRVICAAIKVARLLEGSPPADPAFDEDLVCPVCGYGASSQLNIPGLFCGVDDNNDIIAFCPQCYTKRMKELGVPEMERRLLAVADPSDV